MAPILEGLLGDLGVIHLTFPFVRQNGFRAPGGALMIGRMVFMNVWTMISGLIALYILVFLAAVAGSVLFGCAVYNDAKSKWNDNATMWGVLVGILGLIPGIIYLCVRNEPLKRIYVCHNCGWGNPLSARQCGHCGAGLYYPTEETLQRQEKG